MSELEMQGIEYCILRNYDEIPTNPGRDVDLIVRESDLDGVAGVVAGAARRFGWEHVCRCSGHHEGTSFYFLNPREHHEPVRQLELHCTRVRWARIDILSEEDLIAERTQLDNGLWVASPRHQQIQKLMQHALSGQLSAMKDKYWEQISEYARAAGDDLGKGLDGVLVHEDLSSNLVDRLAASDRVATSRLSRDIRRAFLKTRARRAPLTVGVGIGTTAFDRLAAAVRRRRCGVVGLVGDDATEGFLEEVAGAVESMFLRVEHATLRGENQRLNRSLARTVDHVGLVLGRCDDPWRVAADRTVEKVSCVLDGMAVPAAKSALVERFIGNHRLL